MYFPRRQGVSAAILIGVVLLSNEAPAGALALFRYEHQAQRHCPTDRVVWLDFKKSKYYFRHQKPYGSGFHGSYVCREEARRSLYRGSLLGLR